MLKNYLKIAFRNIIRQKFYSFINIFGLAIGIASCLLIFLYVTDELSYDRFHSKADRIYRAALSAKVSGQSFETTNTAAPLAATMVRDFPEVEAATRLFILRGEVTRYEDLVFTERRAFFADSNFFHVFDFKLLHGNPSTVLAEPQTVVITESTAKKYFGNEPAIGKVLTVGDFNSQYKVTGIAADAPANTHFHFDMLMSMASFEQARNTEWVANSFITYIVLKENASVQSLEVKIPGMVHKYIAPRLTQLLGYSFEKFKETGNKWNYFLQPLTSIHLHSNLDFEIEPTSNVSYVYILTAIAIFIIIIACINFMNLSTARSAHRAKEVGIRKVVGSVKSHLVGQFLTESMVYSIFAMIIGIALAALSLPAFNSISGKELALNFKDELWLPAGIVVLTLLVGLIAGSYPAFYLTSFQPIEVLKGKLKTGVKSSGIRSTLVVMQFAISIGLIICTWLVFEQLQFVRNQKLGFTKENVVAISNLQRLGNNKNAFKQSVLNQPQVVNASISSSIPAEANMSSTAFRKQNSTEDHVLSFFFADHDYLQTLGIDVIKGRNFSKDFLTDSSGVLFNETAAKQLGLDNLDNNTYVQYYGNAPDPIKLKVLGIVKNYNFESLHHEVKGIAIIFMNDQANFLSVRVQPGNAQQTINILEKEWKKVAPNEPFEYAFLEDKFDGLFRAEQRLGKVFAIFTGLAIFIACLGLFGLSSFVTEQRAKEIGVRKVMGASVSQIILLLSKDFVKLVLIAFLLAAPMAYYAMYKWLENFAYRVDISPVAFIAAGLIAVVIAWLTLSYQAIKAAVDNPVNALRSE